MGHSKLDLGEDVPTVPDPIPPGLRPCRDVGQRRSLQLDHGRRNPRAMKGLRVQPDAGSVWMVVKPLLLYLGGHLQH